METGYCTRCHIKPEGEFLREIAYSEKRSVDDMLIRAQQSQDTFTRQISSKYANQRLQEDRKKLQQYEMELEQLKENASYEAMDGILQGKEIDEIAELILQDKTRSDLKEKIGSLKWAPQNITKEDVQQALNEYGQLGYIEIQKGQVKITSKGARKLASNALEKILQSLSRREIGTHSIEKTGFGSELSTYTRNYETGDDYSFVNIERTIINALERRGRLELEPDDFMVYDELHQSRLCAGLIIDESSSMRDNNKLEAAIEATLALSEVIRRDPNDSLRVFTFSQRVKEVSPWAITNEVLSGGTTDIRAAMRAFRKAVTNEKGDRQAYVITDAEPNTEDGMSVGFERAIVGVMNEALYYRKHGIGLNIIMLDETPHLKQVASDLARKSLGRVFFTAPHRLGQVIVLDYFRIKNERL